MRDLDRVLPLSLDSQVDDVISELYKPCLEKADFYYRGVGYFRSSVYRLMSNELVEFCLRGGKVKILTSTDLDPDDYAAAMEGYSLRDFSNTLEDMLDMDQTCEPTKLLCALIATGHLEINIAVVPRGGLYHDKIGFFSDTKGDIIAFRGSGNETYSALVGEGGNIESYDVMWNWHDSYHVHGQGWVERLKESIDEKRYTGASVLELSELDPSFLKKYEISLDLETYLNNDESKDHVQLPELRWNQKKGIKSWIDNHQRGILKHSTGSGKTISALSILSTHMHSSGSAILLVPSLVLMDQWEDEITNFFPNLIIGKIGGGNRDTDILSLMKRSGNTEPYLLISTIRSASKDKNRAAMKRVIDNENSNILMIVDECHNVGSEGCTELCKLTPELTLGLSATPERFGDPDGTQRIFDFLGDVVDEFTLRDALHSNPPILTPYEYHIRTVKLTNDEQQKYDLLRKQIAKLYAIWISNPESDPELKGKLDTKIFESRRIIRGASGKIDAMSDILNDHYAEGQHWLIYCDTLNMLEAAETAIRELGIIPRVYHGEMKPFQRKKTLESFERMGGLLLAIRCLDEGVSIECISHGMVLSSTTNPREFIQRRGRMLRRFPGKEMAYIFDAFALPNPTADETGFILSELLRGKELAEDCQNRTTNVATINRLIRQYGVTAVPEFEIEVIEND